MVISIPNTSDTSSARVHDLLEEARLDAVRHLAPDTRARLGQYLTPAPLADQMASYLACPQRDVHILDGGAGTGTLFASVVMRLCQRSSPPASIRLTAYEIDPLFAPYLAQSVALCADLCRSRAITFTADIRQADFLAETAALVGGDLWDDTSPIPPVTCAILNPPYTKIHAQSVARTHMRRLGLETSNLYAGFVAAAIRLLTEGGELVALTPRSFCNGPYFRPFRDLLLSQMRLDRIHLFDSRTASFADDGVLQENILYHAIKGGAGASLVGISHSTLPDSHAPVIPVAFEEIVRADDPQHVIRIPSSSSDVFTPDVAALLSTRLADLGLSVSTGRVVDFRAKSALQSMPDGSSVPLIYPAHCRDGRVIWPQPQSRKPNALQLTDATRSLLVPNGIYVLTRRFSSVEERRRVVATLYTPDAAPGTWVGFENHLNYFHCAGNGLPLLFACGLVAYLNSTAVDRHFREVSGHTQVNATDLRNLPYPTRSQLERIGMTVCANQLTETEREMLVADILSDGGNTDER